MKTDFICPKCQGHLRIDNHIILSCRNVDNQSGVLLLSPQLGDYKVIKHDGFKLIEGDHLRIFCPACHQVLNNPELPDNLAMINMKDISGEMYEIYFSCIVGEHSTFKKKNADVESYGEDAEHYGNFFGAGPNY